VPPVALVLPANINQADWVPPKAEQNDYKTQSLLYAEVGSIFYKRFDYIPARKFFELALTYDAKTYKALFGLAVIDWKEGKYEAAIKHFAAIDPIEKKLYPYDIDYYAASRLFLSSLPITGKVVSLSRNDRINTAENVIVINRGSVNGLQEKMGFNIFRLGNSIRDPESLDIIGIQKTLIAHVIVTDLSERNAVCSVEKTESNYFIQINDVVESDFGAKK